MFILFGWGHHKINQHGELRLLSKCFRCNNEVRRILLVDKEYFTLFFIPIFPYSTNYFLVCPICGDAENLSRQDFNMMANNTF